MTSTADRRRSRIFSPHPWRHSNHGLTRCLTPCTAASARTAQSRGCLTGSPFLTPTPACAHRRSQWTKLAAKAVFASCRIAGRAAAGSIDVAALEHADPMPLPYVVKPIPTRVHRSVWRSCARAITVAHRSLPRWRFGTTALVEEFVPGREVTVAVMGDRALVRHRDRARAWLLRLRSEVCRRWLASMS